MMGWDWIAVAALAVAITAGWYFLRAIYGVHRILGGTS